MPIPDDVLEEAFAELEIPTMAVVLETGLDAFDFDTLEPYAKLAGGVWLGAPLTSLAGDPAHTALAEHTAGQLFYLITEADPETVDPDQLRHFEWLWRLMSDEATARAFIDLLPPAVRERADAAAARSWLFADVGMDELVGRLAETGTIEARVDL